MKCFNCGLDGHVSERCPWAAMITEELPAQFTRCADCRAVIYAWDKGIPCDRHRTVAGWRKYYHSPQFPADVTAARAQAHGTRAQILDDDDLRELAKQQVSESRSGRII